MDYFQSIQLTLQGDNTSLHLCLIYIIFDYIIIVTYKIGINKIVKNHNCFDSHMTQLLGEAHRCNTQYPTSMSPTSHEQQREFRTLLNMMSQLRDFQCCSNDICFSIEIWE